MSRYTIIYHDISRHQKLKKETSFLSRKRAITVFLSRKFMITRSSIVFEDLLASSIAPQVMPPCLGVWIDILACVLYLGAWFIFGCTKIVAPRYGAKNRIGVAIFAVHHKGFVWFALAIKSVDALEMIYDQDKTYSSSRDLWSRPIPVLPRYLVVFLKLQILRQIANLVLIVLHMINLIVWDPEIWQNIGPLASLICFCSTWKWKAK